MNHYRIEWTEIVQYSAEVDAPSYSGAIRQVEGARTARPPLPVDGQCVEPGDQQISHIQINGIELAT